MIRWTELNNMLAYFPPFARDAQKISEDEACEVIFNMIPQVWRTRMLVTKFDPVDHTFLELWEECERVELELALESRQKDSTNESSKKKDEKSNKRKCKSSESETHSSGKHCMLHGDDTSHTTDQCSVLKQQAKRMRAVWEAQSPEQKTEIRRNKRNQNKKNAIGQDEVNAMVLKSVKEFFTTETSKSSKNRKRVRACDYHEPDDSSESESEGKQNNIKELGISLDEINVSDENYALRRLRHPHIKRRKTNHLTPAMTAKVETRLGKSRVSKLVVLFDTGSSGSIILEKYVKKLRCRDDKTTQWLTKGGIFNTTKKCKTNFVLDEFFENRAIEWNLHVDTTPGPHRYDMLIGRDLLEESCVTMTAMDAHLITLGRGRL